MTEISEYLKTSISCPVLKKAEEKELAIKIRAGNKKARDKFIRANTRLVIDMAKKMKWITEMAFNDLCQEGMMGLIHAVDKFDPDRNVGFSTYAVPWIKQSIERGSIKNKPIYLPSGINEQKILLNKMAAEQFVQIGEIDGAQLARELGRSEKYVEMILRQNNVVQSLHTEEEDMDVEDIGTNLEEHADSLYWMHDKELEQWNKVQKIISMFNDVDRIVLNLRFGRIDDLEVLEECLMRVKSEMEAMGQDATRLYPEIFSKTSMTLSQIGKILGYSREGIRQIERKILTRLRDYLSQDGTSLPKLWDEWKNEHPICAKYITHKPYPMGYMFKTLLSRDGIEEKELFELSHLKQRRFKAMLNWMQIESLVERAIDDSRFYLTRSGTMLLESLQEFWKLVKKNKEKYSWRDI